MLRPFISFHFALLSITFYISVVSIRLSRERMARRLRRGDGAALFGLLWAFSCVFLVALRFSPRDGSILTPSVVSSRASVPQTFEALTRHVQAAKTSIDLSAMYWNLLGEEDRKVYSDAEMVKFGAERGKKLLSATLPTEVQTLVGSGKGNVQVRCWSGPEWYGSGILHQKIWVFDAQNVYVGSANMDWKSLAQVMEVGVIMENLSPSSVVIQDIQNLFETWWMFASSELLPAVTETYFSESFQHDLQVPKWSLYLPEDKRSEDPFVKAGLSALGDISHQLKTPFSTGNGTAEAGEMEFTAAEMFVAAAPLEATAAHSRAFDEDALVYTIRSAKSFVSLSVMDFTPFSMYTPGPLHWPALTDALLAGVYSKPGLQVRLLISQWQHTSPQMLEALVTLKKQAELCQHTRARCSGRLEIKLFRVPGWQNTTSTAGAKASWPSYTRVNHAKYIVTDTRANVGTSNMEWGYFYTTAGASVNTNHEPTRKALEQVFARNWNSSYAKPLEEVMSTES
eukprot:jgi/Phyca11/528591/estExt2_fgenesh1_pm.C_PHYCAscaffold_310074